MTTEQIKEGITLLMSVTLTNDYGAMDGEKTDRVPELLRRIITDCDYDRSELIHKDLADFISSTITINQGDAAGVETKTRILSKCKLRYGEEAVNHINPLTLQPYAPVDESDTELPGHLIPIREGLHKLMSASLDHPYKIPKANTIAQVMLFMCNPDRDIIPNELAKYIYGNMLVSSVKEDALDLKQNIRILCERRYGKSISKFIDPITCKVLDSRFRVSREEWIQQQLNKLGKQ